MCLLVTRSYAFADDADPYDHVAALATNMVQGLPDKDILLADHVTRDFEPAAITELFEMLTPENTRIELLSSCFRKRSSDDTDEVAALVEEPVTFDESTVVSWRDWNAQFGGSSAPSESDCLKADAIEKAVLSPEFNQTEAWFSVPFWCDATNPALLTIWNGLEPNPALSLPPRNIYIPHHLELLDDRGATIPYSTSSSLLAAIKKLQEEDTERKGDDVEGADLGFGGFETKEDGFHAEEAFDVGSVESVESEELGEEEFLPPEVGGTAPGGGRTAVVGAILDGTISRMTPQQLEERYAGLVETLATQGEHGLSPKLIAEQQAILDSMNRRREGTGLLQETKEESKASGDGDGGGDGEASDTKLSDVASLREMTREDAMAAADALGVGTPARKYLKELSSRSASFSKRRRHLPTWLMPPELLWEGQFGRLWYKHDETHHLPRGTLHLRFYCSSTYSSVRRLAATSLWCLLVNDALVGSLYQAELADLHGSLSSFGYGVEITLQGFSDKTRSLVATMLDTLLNGTGVNWQRLDQLREATIRARKNRLVSIHRRTKYER